MVWYVVLDVYFYILWVFVFFVKQKTAYEVRISDWSSDVCSSDLEEDLGAARELVHSHLRFVVHVARGYNGYGLPLGDLIQEGNIGLMKAVKRFDPEEIGRASCRERVCQYV